MFERFTDRARRVVVLAQEEARMLNHNYIGTEHILLGLIHEGEGVAAKALESLGISLEAVRQQVYRRLGRWLRGRDRAFRPRRKLLRDRPLGSKCAWDARRLRALCGSRAARRRTTGNVTLTPWLGSYRSGANRGDPGLGPLQRPAGQ